MNSIAMFKGIMFFILIASAIFVFYPMITGLNNLNDSLNFYGNSANMANSLLIAERNNAVLQITGFVLLYMFAGSILLYLPEEKSSHNLQECPNCRTDSLSDVHMNVTELADSKESSERKLSFNIEYCTKCKKIWLDGQLIKRGSFYDYINSEFVLPYGNNAPAERNEDFDHNDFEALLQDIEKAKKPTKASQTTDEKP